MELTFPFKNYVYNSVIKFFNADYIYGFAASNQTYEEYLKNDFDANDFSERIPSFESELLQVVETTNQATIDTYFKNLNNDLHYLNSLYQKSHLVPLLENWNSKQLDKFNTEIESKTDEFLRDPNRKKAHLESYESYVPIGFFTGISPKFTKIQKINYNFYCIEDKLKFIDISIIDEYRKFLLHQLKLFGSVALRYAQDWADGKIKEKKQLGYSLKPILFCEGEIDIDLIKKAGELLGREDLLEKIEIRQRGSCSNLDKLWKILTEDNWETVPQTKILLYDCDTNRPNEDFGHIFRRTIPKINENPIDRGIENLFCQATIDRAAVDKEAFFDVIKTSGSKRGVKFETNETSINHQEKRNFCNWLLEKGTNEDFKEFKNIFDIIDALL